MHTTNAVASPQLAEADVRRAIESLLMETFLQGMLLLAGKRAQVGRRYLWKLAGDFDSVWLVDLVPGSLGVRRLHAFTPNHGAIAWRLSLRDVEGLFTSHTRLSEAVREGRLRVVATPDETERIAQLFRALAAVDVGRLMGDPSALLGELMDEASAGASVSSVRGTRRLQRRPHR
jgi:hypothetical protein